MRVRCIALYNGFLLYSPLYSPYIQTYDSIWRASQLL